LDIPVTGPISGAAAEKVIASIYDASPALVKRAQAVVDK
jgi:hypothetical protein